MCPPQESWWGRVWCASPGGEGPGVPTPGKLVGVSLVCLPPEGRVWCVSPGGCTLSRKAGGGKSGVPTPEGWVWSALPRKAGADLST